MSLHDALPAIIDDLVDRMFGDVIIGFRFEGKDRARIKQLELEFARRHLFDEGVYTGRGLSSLHKAQRINAGQFHRRMAILKTVLVEHGIEEADIERWLAHDRSMEAAITDGSTCLP